MILIACGPLRVLALPVPIILIQVIEIAFTVTSQQIQGQQAGLKSETNVIGTE